MKVLFYGLLFTVNLGCGYLKKELKGDPGHDGAVGEKGNAGEQGASGQDGEDGRMGDAGRDGESGPVGLPGQTGERGHAGEPGNVDYLVSGQHRCEARYQLNKGDYYRLRLNVWDLSTDERYLNGRSDLFNLNGDFRPDSSSGFGDSVETGSFRFERVETRWRWRHLRSSVWGWFSCSLEKATPQ